MAKRGEITFYLIGKQQRFMKEDFIKFLESKKVSAVKEKQK